MPKGTTTNMDSQSVSATWGTDTANAKSASAPTASSIAAAGSVATASPAAIAANPARANATTSSLRAVETPMPWLFAGVASGCRFLARTWTEPGWPTAATSHGLVPIPISVIGACARQVVHDDAEGWHGE